MDKAQEVKKIIVGTNTTTEQKVEELVKLFTPPTDEGLRVMYPKVVCICGSARFIDTLKEQTRRLTLNGIIVLSIGCNMKTDMEYFSQFSEAYLALKKDDLDELHKRKIDLADEVFILNVRGYIGESTRSEIDYAIKTGKPVKYLEAV